MSFQLHEKKVTPKFGREKFSLRFVFLVLFRFSPILQRVLFVTTLKGGDENKLLNQKKEPFELSRGLVERK